MRKLFAISVLVVGVLVATAVASADAPPPTTFVAVLTAADEVPLCAPAGNDARGAAVFHVVNEATGEVRWKIVANNLPGDIIAAHIHIAPKGVAGPVVQPTPPTAGEENGVVGSGTFTNPALVAALQANAEAYYVNVHSNVCPAGVIRGQLGEHGP